MMNNPFQQICEFVDAVDNAQKNVCRFEKRVCLEIKTDVFASRCRRCRRCRQKAGNFSNYFSNSSYSVCRRFLPSLSTLSTLSTNQKNRRSDTGFFQRESGLGDQCVDAVLGKCLQRLQNSMNKGCRSIKHDFY